MDALRTWREAANLSVPEAASKIGVERATWWRWENGIRPIGVPSLPVIESLTGIPREELRPDIFERKAS
jgi:transcriptional regulator with XRE-family HTH domain